jgi:NADH-quinone oxidoreductase subunit G
MSDFNITVNGQQVPVIKGQTVLQAALVAGIDIPVFCWHPQLVPVGACRICLVEIEKWPKLQVACATIATDGMVVFTDSPKTVKARQGVLEFILAHHPLDCPTCDKGGECDLQNLTFKYGLDYSRQHEPKHRVIVDTNSTFDDLPIGPEIIRNQNRCIHCYRCTRIVDEIAFEDDLGAYQRGYHTEILPPPGREIRNLYSGNVVEYCPVGALTNDDWRYKVRVWLTKQTNVICPHCPDGCNMKLWTFHNKLFRATSNANENIDNGFICDIGRYGYQYVASADRIKRPMVRRAGELVETSWEEALMLIKKQTDDIKSKLSGSGFFGFIGDIRTNEEIYSFQRLLRRVIGSNNIDHRFHRRRRLTPGEEVSSRGIESDSAEYKDIENADVIVVFGSDLHSENPITSLRVKRAVKRHNAKVILLNPLPTPLGKRTAILEVIYRPGTAAVLLHGIIDAMAGLSQFDASAIKLTAAEISDFRKANAAFSGSKGCEISGVDMSRMAQVAEMLVAARKVVILAGSFVERDPLRDSLHLAVANLQAFCKSTQKIFLPPDSNSVGAAFFGAEPAVLPGRQPWGRKAVCEDLWHGPIPDTPGKDTIGILEAIDDDEIECGFVFNADPVRLFPDGEYVRTVMEKLKLLVVIDSFMTDTARLADVILPLSTFAEIEGTRTNWEKRIQYSRRAIPPLHESKPGCEIIELLADRLGVRFNQPDPAGIYQEMAKFLPTGAPTTYAAVGKDGFLIRTAPTDKPGRLADLRFTTPAIDTEYRFYLLVGNADHHRGALTERNDILMKYTGEPFVGISEADATELAVSDGDLVRVESKYGRVAGKAMILRDLPNRRVLLPENFSEMSTNILMGRQDKIDMVRLAKM